MYYYPNKVGRIILLALEEIIGHSGVNATLNIVNLPERIANYPPDNLDMQYSFEELSRIQVGLEQLYGELGGRGVALRSGRACFNHSLREFGPVSGCTKPEFRMLPLHAKLRVGGKLLQNMFNEYTDQRVQVLEESDHYMWEIERCPMCWERHADSPVCHLVVGVLQEALSWVSGGKYFNVEETDCIAKGDPACRIMINKQPLE